jgi:hypothetical protein
MEQFELRGGRYVVTGSLGEGSQGSTFEAVDKKEGRLVAIKRFDVRGAKAWKDVELAEREARVLASLHHPKLPSYIEHFEEEGRLYLVMQKIEGKSLAQAMKEGKRLDESAVLGLLRDAADTLGYMHGQGVVHRDVKPGNVIQRPDGTFAFVDFGAVRDRMRLEGGSTVVGTFGYMAPEQFQGRAQPSSDVYAIGATSLAMLTGKQPEDLPHRGLGIDVETALRGVASKGLTAALGRMLEPDPERRASRVEVPRVARAPRAPRGKRSFVEGWDDEKWSEGWGMSRKEARRVWREARNARREARRAARRGRGASHGPLPVVPLLFVLVGLAIARVAISVALFVAVPLALQALSLVFGKALRDAASAVVRSGKLAYERIDEQARALGKEAERRSQPVDDARVRVSSEERVRVGDQETPPRTLEDEELDAEDTNERATRRRSS